MSGVSANKAEVKDSITSVELEEMQGLSVKDSVVTINIGGKKGSRSINEVATEFRRKIRDLHKNGGRDAARQIDDVIGELLQLSNDQEAAGLPSSAAVFIALQALGHLRRGRADRMAECISSSLEKDPHCEQAHLIAGEFAHQQAQRMGPGTEREEAVRTSIRHHRDVWNYGRSGGSRNNAGYHLCLGLIESKQYEEAAAVKQELLQEMTNPVGLERVNNLEIPSK